jgi:hypothetical protein
MDFKRFIFKFYTHICYYAKYWNQMSLKKMSFINNSMTYSISRKSAPPILLLCHTPSLFLNEIMKNQVPNKIVCSVMKNFNATLMISIYNKYKQEKNLYTGI